MLRAVQSGKRVSAVDGMGCILIELCLCMTSLACFKVKWGEERRLPGMRELTTGNDLEISKNSLTSFSLGDISTSFTHKEPITICPTQVSNILGSYSGPGKKTEITLGHCGSSFLKEGEVGKSTPSLGPDHRGDWLSPDGYTGLLRAISTEILSSLGQFFLSSSPSRFGPKNSASSWRQGLCWMGSHGEVILVEGFHIWHASAAVPKSIPKALHWCCPRIRFWLDSHIGGKWSFGFWK